MVKKLLLKLARAVYLIPVIGLRFRSLMEARLGPRDYQDRAFWNESLSGWASPYLGGTLSIDLRNQITVLLAQRFAPKATSILDLGCAGGTLALCLGAEFQTYCGVDISDVAIAKANEYVKGEIQSCRIDCTFEVAQVQDFQPSR